MGNNMSRHIKESVEENDISLGHTFVWEISGKDIQSSIENSSDKILEDRQFEWPKDGSDHILSGKASKTSDWNSGCKERKDVSVGLMQMKCLDEKNMPYMVKDVRVHQGKIKFDQIAIKVCLFNDIQFYPERRVGYINGLLLQNHQAADDSKKNIHNTQQLTNVLDAEEIFNLVKRGKTRQIPDLENDKGNPMKTSCNAAGYVRGSSGTPNNNETEGDIKMSCAMAFRKKF